MTGSRLVRTSGVLGAAWGALLVTNAPRVWCALTGGSPSEPDQLLTRVLGTRHLAQGLLQAAAPATGRRVLLAVDVTHAASMLALATADRSRRRPALLSAAVAAAGVAVLLAAHPGEARS